MTSKSSIILLKLVAYDYNKIQWSYMLWEERHREVGDEQVLWMEPGHKRKFNCVLEVFCDVGNLVNHSPSFII